MKDPVTQALRPVLLVSCYELGHAPLGLSVPAGVLRRAGIHVETLDLSVERLDEGLVASACLIAISTPMHTALRLGVAAARRIREIHPEVHICFFGMYAALNADRLLDRVADSCLDAEYETPLLELALRLSGAPGTGSAPADAAHHLLPDLGALRHLDRYVKLAWRGGHHRVAQAVTTKGCRHLCTHCPIPAVYNGHFTAIEIDDVMSHVDDAISRGARHVTFSDPDFLNGPTHALRVARRLHQHHPDVTFDYTAKISHLRRHAGLVEELKSLGNLFVVSAVESLNEDVLRHLDKGHTGEDVIDVFTHFRQIGLALRPSLVPFTPWETLESYRGMLDRIAAEGMVPHIEPVQYSVRLLVPPGSLLLGSPSMQPFLDGLDADRFTWRWTHPDPRMDALASEVATIAAVAAEADGDPVDVWHAVRHAAGRAAGEVPSDPPTGVRGFSGPGDAPPRLTEAWFC